MMLIIIPSMIGATMVMALCDHNVVIGGYTSVGWASSHGIATDPNAYIFVINHPVHGTAKFPVTDSEHAVYHDPEAGACFGSGDLGTSPFTQPRKAPTTHMPHAIFSQLHTLPPTHTHYTHIHPSQQYMNTSIAHHKHFTLHSLHQPSQSTSLCPPHTTPHRPFTSHHTHQPHSWCRII